MVRGIQSGYDGAAARCRSRARRWGANYSRGDTGHGATSDGLSQPALRYRIGRRLSCPARMLPSRLPARRFQARYRRASTPQLPGHGPPFESAQLEG